MHSYNMVEAQIYYPRYGTAQLKGNEYTRVTRKKLASTCKGSHLLRACED